MAEIKSTMELVLARAARMGKASKEEMQREEAEKKGLQQAAEYLDNKLDNLSAGLAEQEASLQALFRKNMIEVLLRNIILPRDDLQKERCDRAMRGVVELGGGAGDLESICGDLKNILGQYSQHQQQLREQLENQFRMQLEHIMAQQTGMQGQGAKLDPTMHPKFQEEWDRVKTELNTQYNQAVAQHKTLLKQRLGL